MGLSCESYERKYDVFLSFRGDDTRKGFTSHLHDALCQKGVNTFIDYKELKKGEKISPSLFCAIEGSRISVVVLSKTYASSTSCLDELLKILECKNSKAHLVLPVFYHINPSQVREQKGSFEEALTNHEDMFRDDVDKVKRWRAALCEVSTLSGWHIADGLESKFVKRIVEEILSKLNHTPLNVAKHAVGLDSVVEDIKSLLQTGLDDVRFLGIYGIGGIGKTTAAKAVYNHIANEYEGSAFIANVREVSNQRLGMVQLQEALLSEVFKYGDFKVGNKDRGINLIKTKLYCKKVLIVVDDVDSVQQLECLVGECSWFGAGSRIIITTRDEHLLIVHNVEAAYKVKELSHGHALELFSWFAFKKPFPPTNYEELSLHIINHAKGLPLALTVLGSHLCGRARAEWVSALAKLGKVPNKQIYEVLKISFDGLEENEKAIFLDIACFFKGEDKEYVKMILDGCDFHSDIGIRVLRDKSLITVELNKLWMHELLQEMAKEIVRCESPKEPGKRSRLWFHEDVLHVLNQNMGTNNIEGIKLDLPEPNEHVSISGKAFTKMKRLRLLMINNAQISHDIRYLSDELRLMDWPGYPSSTLPPTFQPKRLVSLKLTDGLMKTLWNGIKIFRDLKLVSFSCCEHLTEIPDFSMIPNLESLSLDHCKSLTKVHESVGSLDKLVTLDILLCSNLKILPSCFKLKSLRTLILTGCSKVRKFPEIVERMVHLEKLLLQGTSIKELPQSIEYLNGLKTLLLDSCKKLEHLPSTLHNLQHLTAIGLSDCFQLKELPNLPLNTEYINTTNCRSLESFPTLFNSSNLPRFSQMMFINCSKLIDKQFQDHITNLLYHEESVHEVMLPGSSIPDWFHQQSTNGLISLEVSSRLYGKAVDMFFGAVFELDKDVITTGILSCVYEIIINDQRILARERGFDSLDRSHVWLTKENYGRLVWPLNNIHRWNHFRISFGICEASSKVKVKASLKSVGFHVSSKKEKYLIDHETVRKYTVI